jgi:ribosome biogenesis GTPase
LPFAVWWLFLCAWCPENTTVALPLKIYKGKQTVAENSLSHTHSDEIPAGVQPLKQGIVYKRSMGSYTIHCHGQVYICAISSKLRKNIEYWFGASDPSSGRKHVKSVSDINAVDPIAIGDQVAFVDAGNNTGMITEVLPRRNALSRHVPNPHARPGEIPLEQVIVANVDQIVPVFAAAQPKPTWNLLDRYLATAEARHIEVFICITKLDIANERELMLEVDIYRQMGYPVLLSSTVTGQGIAELMAVLKDRVSVFVGKSGVGKTSLLNAIQPELGLRVKEVNIKVDRGRHTTTHLEMFRLDGGGGVVDTPGVREFALWQTDELDLAYLFRDLRPYLGECKFGLGCTHTHEPGCAVLAAVERGHISKRRHESYLRMLDD